MRGKRTFELNFYQRSAMAVKDNFESCDVDKAILRGSTGKNGSKGLAEKEVTLSPRSSPISIFTPLASKPPDMPPLPRSVIEVQPPPPPSVGLPPTAVWGRAHKLMLSRRSRHAVLEDIIDEHLSEALPSRARLPVKAAVTTRNEKAMERGLLEKHWKKRRAARRAAREALEAQLAAEDAVDDESAEKDETDERGARKPPREKALKRERARRLQRRAACDLKCFSAEEPVELEALEEAAAVFPREEGPEAEKEARDEPEAAAPPRAAAEVRDRGGGRSAATAMVHWILEEEVIADRARVPAKTKQPLEAKSERKAKEKMRGLSAKQWVKHRALKRVKREAHEAAEAEAKAGSEADEEQEEKACPPNLRKRARETQMKREKIRRAARRNARDRKCFEYGDPLEWIEFSADRGASMPQDKQPSVPLVPLVLLALLQRESTGAALSELSRGGVLLSSAAANDLTEIMASFRKQAYRRRIKQKAEKLSVAKKAVVAIASVKNDARESRPKKWLHANVKMPKAGTMAYMRQPAMLKGKCKRGF